MAPWIRLAALRSVWYYNYKFNRVSRGWELDQRMAHRGAMHRKWHRLDVGPRGLALESVLLYNLFSRADWDLID